MTYFETDDELDNFQRMLDPCNPMDLLHNELRKDWLLAAVMHWRCGFSF
jgi:hypothetical protein